MGFYSSVCVRAFVESVHLPRECYSTTANKLSDCFALSMHPGWKNWAGKSIHQESCCHKCFFHPFDCSRSLSSCAFNLTFFIIWLHSCQDNPRNCTGGPALVISSILFFIFLPVIISHLQCLINPCVALHAVLYSSQLLTAIYSIVEAVSSNLPQWKNSANVYFNHTKSNLVLRFCHTDSFFVFMHFKGLFMQSHYNLVFASSTDYLFLYLEG